MAAKQPDGKLETAKPAPYSVKGKTAIVTGAGSGTHLLIPYPRLKTHTNPRHKLLLRIPPPLPRVFRPPGRPVSPPRSSCTPHPVLW
jgi:hypothetical protein